MPQLDKLSFVPQIFWLLFFFLCLYVFFIESLLPKIHTIFHVRTLKALIHYVRISAIEEERATNKVYAVLFTKLFTSTKTYDFYMDSYRHIAPETYGDEYFDCLKDLRSSNILDVENPHFDALIERYVAEDLAAKK